MTDQDRPKHPRITAIEMEAERMRSRLQPTQAFRDRVMIEVALKLIESGRFQNAIGGEAKAIAKASADLAARLVEYRNND